MEARIVKDVYVPDQVQECGKDTILVFKISSDEKYYADNYIAMPKVLTMDGKYFVKTGWNSDRYEVYYKTVSKSEIAFSLKKGN